MAMDEELKCDSGKTSKTALLWMFFLPLFYVLSIGPTAKLEAAGVLNPEVMKIIYLPLRLACAFEPFGAFVLWYIAVVWQVPIDI